MGATIDSGMEEHTGSRTFGTTRGLSQSLDRSVNHIGCRLTLDPLRTLASVEGKHPTQLGASRRRIRARDNRMRHEPLTDCTNVSVNRGD